MKKILLLVVTIYLIIAPITYHPDTKLVLYYATLGNEKIWNIYKYLNDNLDNAPKFHYPPMNYWLVKSELPFVKLVGGTGIVKWLDTGSNIAFLDKNIFLYNLATKLPIILTILITGFLIYKIAIKSGLSENKSRFAALIWYLNPITVFSGVIMGQNDIFAIFPFVVGLYFYFDYPILAFLLFGLGGSVKSFPLIWAIALAGVYPTKNYFKKILLVSIPLLFYLMTLLPFLKYDYFVQDVLNSGLSKRMFELSVIIPVVPFLLVIATLIGMKKSLGDSYVGLCTLMVTINLVILAFSNFNPQWFMWIMPFLSILLVVKNRWLSFLFILVPLFGITILFDDKYLYWGLISSVNPSLINLPFISEIFINIVVNTVLLNNTFRIILGVITGYWLILCAKFKN